MSLTSFLIAPFQTGLDTDLEPWLAPPDSFREANNVHVHHGYIEKRSGYKKFGSISTNRVMGIYRYLTADGTKLLLAFDTTNAYLYNASTKVFDKLDDPDDIFDSDQYDYIHAVNWQSPNEIYNRLYFTNGKKYTGSLNGIRYYNNDALGTTATTTSFTPEIRTGWTLYGCKLVFTLGQRLICLWTFENDGADTIDFPQRARWCAKDNPNNWNDVIPGGGNYNDAATGDQIISAQPLKNQIIVFFTNSVWSLQYTGIPNNEFRWVRLNNYRACDGKMASVLYDRNAIAIGIRGITSTDGNTTERIDNRIVDFANNLINTAEIKKVFCHRSYETQRWWTLYPSIESDENDKVLIYDDESKAYTTYDLALNSLGYGNSDYAYTFDDFSVANDLDFSFDEMGNDTFEEWYFDQYDDILLGGTIDGDILQLEFGANDVLDEVITPIDASFTTASWNPFIKEGLECQMSFIDFYVDADMTTTGNVEIYMNDQTSPYATESFDFLPNLDFIADINTISNSNPAIVNAPEHGLMDGDAIYIYGVLGMQQINNIQFIVTVIDENTISLNGVDSSAYNPYGGGGGLYLRQFYSTKTWKRVFAGGIGYNHWIKVNISGTDSPSRIHGIKPAFRKRGKRVVN